MSVTRTEFRVVDSRGAVIYDENCPEQFCWEAVERLNKAGMSPPYDVQYRTVVVADWSPSPQPNAVAGDVVEGPSGALPVSERKRNE